MSENLCDFSGLSDDELISLVKSGNTDFFGVFINRFVHIVNYYVSGFTSPYIDSDDIFQEGIIALYSAAKVYKSEKSSFTTFASLCVKRSIISYLRRTSQKSQIPPSVVQSLEVNDNFSSINGPESFVEEKESFNSFKNSIKEKLSDFEYLVLVEYLSCGDYATVCNNLNVSRKEVDNALQRARKKIRVISSESC